MKLSERIQEISPSITLGVTARAKLLKSQGVDIISFGAGEPDFPTPEHIRKAAAEAIEAGFTRYTPSTGTQELKEAICKKFQVDNDLMYKPTQIAVGCGAKHSLFNTMQAICNEGDEVIIPSPYWVSYPEMVKFSGAKPVIVKTNLNEGLKLTPELLQKAINKKTKVVIINSPSNPTGVLYEKDELERIAEVIVNSKLYVISDEIYENLIYDGLKHTSIASLSNDLKERTFVVNGVSKSYAMTGWRIGYVAGPEDAIAAIKRLQDQSTSNPTSISQKAALAAITGSQSCVEEMKVQFEKRRELLMKLLDSIDSLSYVRPQGAFYLFCNISKTGMKSLKFAERLLEEAKVAVIPGIGFGWDDYVRMSFATSEEDIKEGLSRIEKWLKQ